MHGCTTAWCLSIPGAIGSPSQAEDGSPTSQTPSRASMFACATLLDREIFYSLNEAQIVIEIKRMSAPRLKKIPKPVRWAVGTSRRRDGYRPTWLGRVEDGLSSASPSSCGLTLSTRGNWSRKDYSPLGSSQT